MVRWNGDGIFGGMVRRTFSGSSVATVVWGRDAGRFAFPSAVDAQIITRLQYSVNQEFRTGAEEWFYNGVYAVASLEILIADFNPYPGRRIGMGLVVVPANTFPGIPSQADIWNARGSVYRSPGLSSAEVGLADTREHAVAGPGPTALQPNTKYWALFLPVTDWNEPIGDPNVNGRALSFWTNRTPLAPSITSPASGTLVQTGGEMTFSFKSNDPDAFLVAAGDYRPFSFSDLAGVQVQYAPRPSVENPNPVWKDLPVATTGASPVLSPGWFIQYADSLIPSNGIRALRDNGTIKIRCGSDVLTAGYGSLPAGDWQLRMRTFDFGHPASTVQTDSTTVAPGYGPLGSRGAESPAGGGPWAPTNYTPDTYPAGNTSPWSDAVTVTVPSQVPPPVALSPVNSTAIPAGRDVTLRWQYRNTHVPPNAQRARTVQMREVGAADWTTLISGPGALAEYALGSPAPVIPPAPVEYLADPGFENNTTSGWLTDTGSGVSVVSGNPHSGTRSLQLNTATSVIGPNFYQFFTLQAAHKYITVGGWVLKGAVTQQQILTVTFTNDNNDSLGFKVVVADAGTGYKYVGVTDFPRPAGATKVLVQVQSTASTTGATYSGDRMDDWSFKGSVTPMSDPAVEYNPFTLEVSTEYEWRVRTVDAEGSTSNWSETARFWIVPAPTSGVVRPVPTQTIEGAELGCGTHRVEVYRRGGKVRVGELTGLTYVDWGRERDEISTAKIIVQDWDIDCGNLLGKLKSWAYELRVYRDNGYSRDRVWEGPITLLTYEEDDNKVTIQAKDVMAYAYRRIIKQIMNDSGNSATKGDSVVSRAARVLQNVFAPDDPNILAYLTVLSREDDAQQYRNLPAWSRTAYEEIDDMAANSGLDYTAVGRAILLWGTKHRIGTLPEWTKKDLGASPIISEYGMSMANVYAVSDGNGVSGHANRLNADGEDPDYGLVEMLSSSWASDSEAETGTYTQAGLATVVKSFEEYAERSIADRYPPPVVVRIPDNTSLNPNMVLSIQQLVPGVVIPLRVDGRLRKMVANQKLDSLKVVEQSGKETISVTLSPFSRDDAAAGEEVEA